MRELPGKAKIDSRQDKKELILRAATRVFARKGFHLSRTHEIAKKAGVAEGTIYNYFRKKDDILISIFEAYWDKFVRAAREISSSPMHPDDKIASILSLALDSFGQDKDIAWVVLVELKQSSRIFSEKCISMVIDFLEILESVVKEGIRKGIYRKDLNTTVIRAVLFGTVEAVLLSWVLSGEHPAYKKRRVSFTLEDARKTILSMFRDGITRRGR